MTFRLIHSLPAFLLLVACATGAGGEDGPATGVGASGQTNSSAAFAASTASSSSSVSAASTSGAGAAAGAGGVMAGAGGTGGAPAGSGGAGANMGSGGATASSTGGTGAGGATGSGGSGGCAPGSNIDGDGLDDCTELSDGDPWTDPAIFNGMHVRWAEQCDPSPSCAKIDTLAEVDACVASQPLKEETDQYAGWDWNDAPDNICSPQYGFEPSWTVCNDSAAVRWQADWTGYIKLAQSGLHCFSVTGSSNGGCASLFFFVLTNGPTHDSGPKCYSAGANSYAIRWHYEMTSGSTSDMHVNYCFGGNGTCTPTLPIPAAMLRVSP